MKTWVASIIFATAIAAAAPASAERGKRMSPEQRVERMTERLGLSTEQQSAVLDLMESASAQRKASRDSGDAIDREASKAAFEAELAEILTEEQFTQFQNRPEPRGKRSQRGANRS